MPMEAWRAKEDQIKAERMRRDQYRRQVAASIACEDCYATKEQIAGEQARLRREFYERHPELAL